MTLFPPKATHCQAHVPSRFPFPGIAALEYAIMQMIRRFLTDKRLPPSPAFLLLDSQLRASINKENEG